MVKVLLFGATGMVGQGVLRECLRSDDVARVVSVGRAATFQQHGKLREIVHRDLFNLSPIERDLSGFDAAFFCLGVSSAGMNEQTYTLITHDLTISVAKTLARLNPQMTFIYVSGAGTNADGRVMWARVKGRTEDALLRLPFKAAYMFRPAFIQPMHGVTSRTKLYRFFYAITAPVFPLLKRFPKFVTTTERIGRAMINVAIHGADKKVLESRDIDALGR